MYVKYNGEQVVIIIMKLVVIYFDKFNVIF